MIFLLLRFHLFFSARNCPKSFAFQGDGFGINVAAKSTQEVHRMSEETPPG